MNYKITKGPTSERNFGCGYNDKQLPIYIDREDVAKYFLSIGWPYEEIETTDEPVINCLEIPLLKRVISKIEQIKAGKKTGKWRIHLPPQGLPRFRYGHDTKEEIITEDFDKMKLFVADGCTVKVIEEEQQDPQGQPEPVAVVEGEDVQKRGPGRPRKGGPMTTYDLPKSARE